MKSIKSASLFGLLVWLFAAGPALGSTPVSILQYFEAEWDTIRHRMPDVFMAGYESLWLPPPQKGAGGTSSIGYDLFDRFDLGSNASPTRYGTESSFRLMVEEAHAASVQIYVDWLMNHNASWDNNTPGFLAQGGYPGFVLEYDGDDYGDFNAYSAGCPQSENPSAGCYNLYDGRLLGLIDIDQGKNHSLIRHPVDGGNPDNIPAGTLYNQPDPNNYSMYPDIGLGSYSPTNPGTDRNPSPPQYSFYSYNTADPMAGDPVTESATTLLLRSTQYYLEVLGVDGFRLDAAKHIETWFWDNMWDAAVHNRYVGFDGVAKNPYSFVEAVEGNWAIVNWVRRPAGPYGSGGWPSSPTGNWDFANRDALDLNEAGRLRNIVGEPQYHSWGDVMGDSVDNVDGYNNGTIGVHHVTSHDNSFGWDGGNYLDDTVAQAFVLLRTGSGIVYYNALQFGYGDFPEPSSRQDALGLGNDRIPTLVKIRNQYGRGYLMPLNSNTSSILVFTRQTPGGEDNLLVGLNDLHSNGYDTLGETLNTAFPSGTRLHELTGNAAASGGTIPELITVGGGGTISGFRIPRSGSPLDGGGYVVYGPAVPTGTLSIENATTTIVPPEAGGSGYYRRLSEVVMITSPTFDIQLQTTQADPSDPNTDDLAVFRIDKGFVDYNGNSGVDYLDDDAPDYGFEDFLTQNSPLYGGGSGTYRQTIDAAALGEGYHYITVNAYRHRPAGQDPLFGEFRLVVYVDLEDPDFEMVSPTNTCDVDVTSVPLTVEIQASDTTIDRVHVFLDYKHDTDFVTLAGTAQSPGPGQADRNLDAFTKTYSSLFTGNHRIDVVAFEESPEGGSKVNHKTFTGIQSVGTGTGIGEGDLNLDGSRDGKDIKYFMALLTGLNPTFDPAGDLDCDGVIDLDDIDEFVLALLGE